MTSNILSDIPAHMVIIDNNTCVGRAVWRPYCLVKEKQFYMSGEILSHPGHGSLGV